MKNKKHLHFIGIAGSAMAQLAVAFKKDGFDVTGSEPHEVFEPMKSYLKKNNIKYYYPFSNKKIEKLVDKKSEIIIGNAFYSPTNPEVKFARDNNFNLIHFPQLVEKYLIKKNSVVVAGTYGKSTITSMLAWLFEKADKKFSYMLGGLPINFKHGARLNNSVWSIVEGDEYPAASPWDYSSKFDYYHPKYLILTSAEWDHFDIFKTKKSYLDTFKKMVSKIPSNGLIVAKWGGENLDEVLKCAKCRIVYYTQKQENIKSLKQKNIYQINNVEKKVGQMHFTVKNNNTQIAEFNTSLIGDFNLENWCAAIVMAHELKLPIKKIQAGVKTFKGVKRRLEIRSTKKITVVDDFAHSPSKARQSVDALVKHFSNAHRGVLAEGNKHKIFVVFEPNRGGRALKCMPSYNNVFKGIYKIFIPKLNTYVSKPGVYDVTGQELANHLKKTHPNVVYQSNPQKIIQNILKTVQLGDVVAFMGSRNFDDMIKEIIKNKK